MNSAFKWKAFGCKTMIPAGTARGLLCLPADRNVSIPAALDKNVKLSIEIAHDLQYDKIVFI